MREPWWFFSLDFGFKMFLIQHRVRSAVSAEQQISLSLNHRRLRGPLRVREPHVTLLFRDIFKVCRPRQEASASHGAVKGDYRESGWHSGFVRGICGRNEDWAVKNPSAASSRTNIETFCSEGFTLNFHSAPLHSLCPAQSSLSSVSTRLCLDALSLSSHCLSFLLEHFQGH